MVAQCASNAMSRNSNTFAGFNPAARSFRPRTHFRFDDVQYHTTRKNLLDKLPDLILIAIFGELSLQDLNAVAQTSSRIRLLVVGFSVADRIRDFLPTYAARGTDLETSLYTTMRPEYTSLSPLLKLFRLNYVEQNHEMRQFSITREASWANKTMPVLKADSDKMILGTGNELYFSFRGADWTISKVGNPGIGDISDIALTEVYNEVIISFVDGRIVRARLDPEAATNKCYQIVKQYRAESRNPVEAVDYLASKARLLSVYQYGQLILNWSNVKLEGRPWTSRFIGSGARIATGIRGKEPLIIHTADTRGLRFHRSYAAAETCSSVFAIESISDSLILSGWYDGSTRLHDLRCKSTYAVSTWKDPMEDAAAYSLAVSGNSIYTGTALNAVVRMFDFRTPFSTNGISLFLEDKLRSPVYALVAENEKVFGATERSVLGIDFLCTHAMHSSKTDSIANGIGGCEFYMFVTNLRVELTCHRLPRSQDTKTAL